MNVSSRAAFLSRSTVRIGSGVAAVTLSWAMTTPAHSVTLGHSRVLSKPGEALAIDVQIRDITAADRSSLTVGIPPIQAWTEAGLTPPVSLEAMRVAVAQGSQAASGVIQIRSAQGFEGPVADLLLDVGSATGTQRHQVSLLIPDTRPVHRSASSADARAALGRPAGADVSDAALDRLAVRKGDNLFALSHRHVPEGVSIYQWMIAVHRANPQAFIGGNINLVKAGANLSIPDAASMTALSDRQARRLFRDLTASLSGSGSGQGSSVLAMDAAAGGQVSDSSATTETQAGAKQDRLRLTVADEKAGAALAATGPTESAGAEMATASEASSARKTGAGSAETHPTDNAGAVSAETRHADNVGAGSIVGAGDSVKGHGKVGSASVAASDGQQQSLDGSELVSDDELAVRKDLAETGGRVSQLETNIRNLNQAMQAQGLAATTLVEDGANEISQTLSVAGKALAEASVGADAILAVPESAPAKMNKVDKTVSWLQNNLLAIVTIILAVLVLVLAWALRRASGARAGRDGSGGVITEAMVKEKLDQINLDLAAEDKSVGRMPKD